MGRRLELHEKLCDVLGSRNVYWQPPESIKLVYPCIVYEEDIPDDDKADNKTYINHEAWTVTVIRTYKNRDETKKILDKLRNSFMYCEQGRHAVYDNLINDEFTIYY